MYFPIKVYVAAILLLIAGVFGVVFGFIQAVVGGVSWLIGILPFTDTTSAWGAGAAGNGLVNLVIGIGQVVAAIGLFLRQPWAWILAVVVTGVSALGPLLSIFSGHFLSISGLILPAVILLILVSPDVRRAFGRAPA
jgi:hypothetical protein